MNAIAKLGGRTVGSIIGLGDFFRFSGRAWAGVFMTGLSRPSLHALMRQFYEIGTKSIPVVVITGAFIGAVLAVQTVVQFRSIGLVSQMGSIVNLSTLRELGPVLAGVLLAGRVGGGLTAELGTMRVTEQIDALRAMGTDPINVLVVPRLLACVLLIPILVIYADFMGILGGYVVSVHIYGVNSADFWTKGAETVTQFDIFYGPIKSVFFGIAISLIACYKGFKCAPGAAGVGRACTDSFVASCMTIIALDFFLGMFLNTIYEMIHGTRIVL